MFDPSAPDYTEHQQQQPGQIKPPMRPRSLKASSGSSFRTLPRKHPLGEVDQERQQIQNFSDGIKRSASMKSIKEDVVGAILQQLAREQSNDPQVGLFVHILTVIIIRRSACS